MAGPRRLALVGAKGMLATMVAQNAPANWEILPLDLPEFDLTDEQGVRQTLTRLQPELILNCAAFTNVDACESQEELATRVNGVGAMHLARAAAALDATLVHISTDYVFDGLKAEPYLEQDAPDPRSAYGRSKLAGERAILASGLQRYFIIRTSWLYGPGGKNFVETILRLAAEREELRVVADQVGSPTYTGDLARALFRLLELEQVEGRSPYGIYHFANAGQCSWFDFAAEIVRLVREAGGPVKARQVAPIRTEDYPLPAQRPAYSVLSTAKYRAVTGQSVPPWQESLRHYLQTRTSN
ncbi:NAD(P)-dependent oxidoreductase [Desulfuromonas versatilis]|uniref:dTDP-4-dehydrorhamnose reductase n=2 Tax=Desulfuromonas versatilis TaxID=2802975 RepID=A0ABM8HXY8_9BACT|nr:NAD(P)-dependent oxidoreductase [Desulfuromonas versatilis]